MFSQPRQDLFFSGHSSSWSISPTGGTRTNFCGVWVKSFFFTLSLKIYLCKKGGFKEKNCVESRDYRSRGDLWVFEGWSDWLFNTLSKRLHHYLMLLSKHKLWVDKRCCMVRRKDTQMEVEALPINTVFSEKLEGYANLSQFLLKLS